MSAARSDEPQIDVLLSGTPEKRERYVLESLAELKVQTASIAQHCRYCNDGGQLGDAEQEHVNWLIRIVGAKLFLPLAVTAGNVLITLALTGRL